MPKKHTPSYAHTKPKPTYGSASPTSSRTPLPLTVNERIQQLRREQAPKSTAQRRDEVTEVVTKRTVPPHLRRILQMAEVDSPLPKPGTRARPQRPGARPPPGPAAPSSWLTSSRHAPAHIRNLRKFRHGGGRGAVTFCPLAMLHDAEYKRFPSRGSLMHQCLRTLAIHWEELVEYEQHYLPSLPIYLKEALLSYLSVYGEKGCLSLESLKILFGTSAEVEGGSGSEEIRFLDFTGLLNPKYSLVDLKKSLLHPQWQSSSKPSSVPSVTNAIAEVSLAKGKNKAPAEVADSWEDELDETTTTAAPLLPTLSIPLFPNLTRLSLAHPGETASWVDLLAVSPRLKTLTHLSLAYWPTPSTTPNAAAASMVSSLTSPVALGGSHFYSELDDDWHEAANILRRLSKNTYCLKWLDLEGCTWHKALTWDHFEQIRTGAGLGAQDNWIPSAVPPGPDWNAAWRQVEYVNISQGWMPGDAHSLRTMPAGVIPVQLLRWLREHGEDPEYRDKLRMDCGYEATQWVEREKVARNVAMEIQSARKRVEGKWCRVDHGWEVVPSVQRRRGSDESA